ncbi:MAG: glycosyltransferase [Nitrospira sp.]|nr:glycosyltransferase [Nitrospira sp.]
MKIVHLSASDIGGGAALAAYRLHRGLQRAGHDSSMLVAKRSSQDSSVLAFSPPNGLTVRIRRRFRRLLIDREFSRYRLSRPPGYEPFSDDRTPYGETVAAQLPPCDVVNLHWIAGFVDYQGLFGSLPGRTPIVWRLADMNALTGGCHYDDDCGQLGRGCGMCPQLGSGDREDLSRQVWLRKQKAFGALEPNQLHIVTLCRWMSVVVRESPILSRFPVTHIPNGVDLEEFSPRDRRLAREVLGIPHEARVVMFVSDQLTNRRKGFSLLIDALAGMTQCPNLVLMSVGKGQPPLAGGIPCLHFGHVNNDRWLSLIYSAADVFVIPSLQDNLPNTVLESMACGTPVIGFAVGGISDMVRDGLTGLMVPPRDVGGLRTTILGLLENPSMRASMSEQSRRIAVQDYSRELQVRRYLDLYKSLV